MNQQTFTAKSGDKLIIKNRKSAVIFELDPSSAQPELRFNFEFTTEAFMDLFAYFQTISNHSWTNIDPKEATSLGADYYEYYDRELDNNGYLSLRENALVIERPTLESLKLYQFNKKKMESFLFDFAKQFEHTHPITQT